MRDQLLSPAAYDAAERAALEVLPNRIIEAFRPEIFNLVGYPTRMDSHRSLHRYADVMHEGRAKKIMELYLGELLPDELDLLKEVTSKTVALLDSSCGKRVVPKSALLWAFVALRHIRTLFPDTRTRILEIGPGSGYLGCLCGLLGYTYIATEVTQGFYVYQSALWRTLFGDRFIELADESEAGDEYENVPPGTLLHIPWWKFASAAPNTVNLPVDCVACVDMIAEMHVFAMRYLGRQVVRWFGQSPGNKLLYVQGTGAQLKVPMIDIVGALRIMGLDLTHSDRMQLPEQFAPHDMFYFFTPKERPYPQLPDLLAAARGRWPRNSVSGMEQLTSYYQSARLLPAMSEDEAFWDFCNREDWKEY